MITVQVGEDFAWQLPEPSESYNTTTVDMKDSANFMDFDQSSLKFSIIGQKLTSAHVGDHLIQIKFELADGNSLK